MRKIKLFMMLALLVAGVNGVCAQQQRAYGVEYSPSDLEGVGFTIINSHFNDDVEVVGSYSFSSGTHAGERLIVLEGAISNWTNLTDDNVSTYIKANDIEGYNSTISVVSTS